MSWAASLSSSLPKLGQPQPYISSPCLPPLPLQPQNAAGREQHSSLQAEEEPGHQDARGDGDPHQVPQQDPGGGGALPEGEEPPPLEQDQIPGVPGPAPGPVRRHPAVASLPGLLADPLPAGEQQGAAQHDRHDAGAVSRQQGRGRLPLPHLCLPGDVWGAPSPAAPIQPRPRPLPSRALMAVALSRSQPLNLWDLGPNRSPGAAGVGAGSLRATQRFFLFWGGFVRGFAAQEPCGNLGLL